MNSAALAASGQNPFVQKQLKDDWANREYIEVISANIKKISDFLNSFGKFACLMMDVLKYR